jgi:hypothetical protein
MLPADVSRNVPSAVTGILIVCVIFTAAVDGTPWVVVEIVMLPTEFVIPFQPLTPKTASDRIVTADFGDATDP